MNNLIINCEEPTIFIGCNSVSNCIDWGINNNLIVFGAYKFVVIYNCKVILFFKKIYIIFSILFIDKSYIKFFVHLKDILVE